MFARLRCQKGGTFFITRDNRDVQYFVYLEFVNRIDFIFKICFFERVDLINF